MVSAPLVWIDLETTGLEAESDAIIEIFCLITSGDLDFVEPVGWGAVVHQSQQRMDEMDPWCVQTHGESGLTAAVLKSNMTAEQASSELLGYIKKWVPQPKKALLAGNSVFFDKAFLQRQPYKKVHDHFNRRIFDVSCLSEAMRRWSPTAVVEGVPRKKYTHKARDDILESIAEARYYKDAIFQAVRDGRLDAVVQGGHGYSHEPSVRCEKAARTSMISTPGHNLVVRLKSSTDPFPKPNPRGQISSSDPVTPLRLLQPDGTSPTLGRFGESADLNTQRKPDLVTTVLDLISADSLKLRPSTEVLIRHEIGLTADMGEAKVHRYEGTISELRKRIDELEAMVLLLT